RQAASLPPLTPNSPSYTGTRMRISGTSPWVRAGCIWGILHSQAGISVAVSAAPSHIRGSSWDRLQLAPADRGRGDGWSSVGFRHPAPLPSEQRIRHEKPTLAPRFLVLVR